MKTKSWYAKTTNTGSPTEQGLVIDEQDGRNVAVAYDSKDAPLLAAAPDLLDVVHHFDDLFTGRADEVYDDDGNTSDELNGLIEQVRAAIAKAEGQ